ncbi:MAG: hypothetical protein N3A69_14090, partial [Leptospiraceae bacterium]|nr:hypothetical protein [Leptospiraceae bacterium]
VNRKVRSYMELLLNGEHVILDVDHWFLFLETIESLPEKERKKFWEGHKKVAQAHVEQLRGKITNIESLLTRLEDCNFFKFTKNSEKEFTLVLGSALHKNFVRLFLEEFLSGIGVKFDIKENFSKLNITIRPR